MKLTIAAMMRNECSRFLPSALAAWRSYSDQILVLNDGSTDDTADVCKAYGARVFERDADTAWGNEAPARQKLFDLAVANTNPGDWILFADADMTLAKDPRPIIFNGRADAWAIHVFDLWDQQGDQLFYRQDGYWQGHLAPRVWLIKRPVNTDFVWQDRGIHCGHLPANLQLGQTAIIPVDYAWLHYAYITPELRQAKFDQYMSVREQLGSRELAHAVSIIDENPSILPLRFHPDFTLTQPTVLKEAA